MGTSFTGEVSSDRLTSYPGGGENHLSAKRHGNRRLAPTLWALWPAKDKLFRYESNKTFSIYYQHEGGNLCDRRDFDCCCQDALICQRIKGKVTSAI